MTLPLPLIRATPWYPGQIGVPGSDVSRGLRSSPAAIVLYVDENHPGASATADGTDPESPLTSVQTAVNRLIAFQAASAVPLNGSMIVIGANATIVESVIIPSTAPKHCSIIGESNGNGMPTWTSAVAAGIALTVRQQGWRISGIHFVGQVHDDNACIRLEWDGTDTINASYTQIDSNIIDGAYGGKYGLTYWGAPYNVNVVGNLFTEFIHGDNTGACIWGVAAPTADALEWQIVGNTFWESENYITSAANDYGFNGSVISNNVFALSAMHANGLILDLRGGSLGGNTVFGNVFPGDYSQPGGYWDGAAGAGCWIGNLTPDVAEAEVGDNGFTILPPAA